jgi:site-specific recombinase XerC
MAFNLTNTIGTGTDEEMLEFARAAIVQIMATGQAYGTNGRSLTRAELAELREMVTWLENRINAAAGSSAPTQTYVRLRRPC